MIHAAACGPRRARQRGAALLTAMIIVTLVTTLAASMVWQQWRAVRIEGAQRARAQANWILAGALDFALLILREDQRNPRDKLTRLTEPWATPLAESRLSTFLSAAENPSDADDDGPQAFLSGTIADAQAKYNLLNLLNGSDDKRARELKTLGRLCQSVGVDPSVAATIANGLATANAAEAASRSDAPPAPLRPSRLAELRWLGVGAASIKALEPYATILPKVTAINLNTAPKEVLAAATGADLGSVERVLQMRQRTPFRTSEDFYKQLGTEGSVATSEVNAITSEYFEVTGRLRLADHVITQHSLVQRTNVPPFRKILHREWVSSLEESNG